MKIKICEIQKNQKYSNDGEVIDCAVSKNQTKATCELLSNEFFEIVSSVFENNQKNLVFFLISASF